MKHYLFRQFKFQNKGASCALGKLEARVMEIIWQKGQVTVRQVCDVLSREKPISFNTVMTVMNRLVSKGILKKKQGGATYEYTPVQTKEKFLDSLSSSVIKSLMRDYKEFALAHFAEALDEEDMKELLKLKKNGEKSNR